MFLRRKKITDSYNPFSKYELKKLTKISDTHFVFREEPDLILRVTGYGAKDAKFEEGYWQNPKDCSVLKNHPVQWFPMENIEKFKELLPKLNPEPLKDICLKYIHKNSSVFKTKIDESLPLDLQEEMQEFSNKPK